MTDQVRFLRALGPYADRLNTIHNLVSACAHSLASTCTAQPSGNLDEGSMVLREVYRACGEFLIRWDFSAQWRLNAKTGEDAGLMVSQFEWLAFEARQLSIAILQSRDQTADITTRRLLDYIAAPVMQCLESMDSLIKELRPYAYDPGRKQGGRRQQEALAEGLCGVEAVLQRTGPTNGQGRHKTEPRATVATVEHSVGVPLISARLLAEELSVPYSSLLRHVAHLEAEDKSFTPWRGRNRTKMFTPSEREKIEAHIRSNGRRKSSFERLARAGVEKSPTPAIQ